MKTTKTYQQTKLCFGGPKLNYSIEKNDSTSSGATSSSTKQSTTGKQQPFKQRNIIDFQTNTIEEKVKQLNLDNQFKAISSNNINKNDKNTNNHPPNNGNNKTSLGKYSFTLSANPVDPPPFYPISLLYTEEEMWTRLQIREFIFKFSDVLNIETRFLAGLQNVQGDWRVRRLSTTLVWEALMILSGNHHKQQHHHYNNTDVSPSSSTNTTSSSFIGINHHQQQQQNSMVSDLVKQFSSKTLNEWAIDFGLTRSLIPNKQERIERTGEMLSKKGMNGQRWQDVAEILATADYDHLPIPTLTNNLRKQQQQQNDHHNKMDIDDNNDNDNIKEDDDDDLMDIDQEIIKFRNKERTPLTTADELYMIQLLLDTLLLDNKLRSQLFDPTKLNKQLDEDLKTYRKQYEQEEIQLKSKQKQLSESIDQFTSLGQKDKASYIKKEYDLIMEQLKKNKIDMNKKELEILIQKRQFDKRSNRLITPWDGNEYYLFHDLLSHHHIEGLTTDVTKQQQKQQQEDAYWAYGIIVIGKDPNSTTSPSCNDKEKEEAEDVKEKEKEESHHHTWWHISSIPHLQKLDKWLSYCMILYRDHDYMTTLESDIKTFKTCILQHMQYLKSLEAAVYGQGYFN